MERWQGDTRQEDELRERFDQVRSNPRPTCGIGLPPWGAPPPIKTDDALQCVARLAFSNPQRGITAMVTGRTSSGGAPNFSRDVEERVGEAGAPFDVYEVLVIGADDAEHAMAAILNSSEASTLCWGLTTQKVGIAHIGNVWVIDFAVPTQTSPAHSGPMPGDH